jgi:hypothetical protein
MAPNLPANISVDRPAMELSWRICTLFNSVTLSVCDVALRELEDRIHDHTSTHKTSESRLDAFSSFSVSS